MTSPLNENVIVITGASSGLGEATARHLADLGASVVLAARREDRLEALAADIRKKGGTVAISVTDVTQKDQVDALMDTALSHFGKIDVLVNNAGYMAIAPMDEANTDEWDRMIDINIKGVLYGMAACLPVFRKQNSGHVVNIASIAGFKVFSPGGAVYSGTKHAVRAITDGFRHEAGDMIRTTLISPGAVDSELKYGSSHKESRDMLNGFYGIAIPSDSVARAIFYAISQPNDVDINEIVLRPTVQEF